MRVLKPVLMSLMVVASSPAFAQMSLSCEALFNHAAHEELSIQELKLSADSRRQAADADARIQKLGAKLARLRELNGSWETAESGLKRRNADMFESLLMIDDMDLLKTHFGNAFAGTGTAAIHVLASEAVLKKYEAMKSTQSSPELDQLIASEKQALATAKAEFLDYADKTMSLQLVIEVMKKQGIIVDPTSLFSGRTQVRDLKGNAVDLEATPVLNTAAKSENLVAVVPAPAALPEATTPSAAPVAAPSIVATVATVAPTTAELGVEEIKARAVSVDKLFKQYIGRESVKKTIEETRRITGVEIAKDALTMDQLTEIRNRVKPDWQSTSESIRRAKANLWEERKLRLKLLTLGPQMTEIVRTWFSSLSGKNKKLLGPIAAVSGQVYDNAVKRRHIPRIMKILALHDPKEQLVQLQEKTKIPYARDGELIVTFVRIVRTHETWEAIKGELKKSDSELSKIQLAQFEEYEKEAANRGWLTMMDVPNDPIGTGVSTALATVASTATIGSGATWVVDKAYAHSAAIWSHANVEGLLSWYHTAASALGIH